VKSVTITGNEVHGVFKDENSALRTLIPANFPDIYRTLRDRRLVELMPADGFADDVSESVFERNAHVRSKPESRAGCPE
jgi:hypothetical protein